MTLQFRFGLAPIVPHIRMAALRALVFATGATAVVWLLGVLIPEGLFWLELTVVAFISAAVTFPFQLAFCLRSEALRDTQKELQHVLHHDPVTGTTRADEFANSVAHAIDRRRVSTAENSDGVMLVLRVDNFDEIGRRYGPQWADTLLQSIVRIVYSSVRYGDLVARLASDELGICWREVRVRNVAQTCHRKARLSGRSISGDRRRSQRRR